MRGIGIAERAHIGDGRLCIQLLGQEYVIAHLPDGQDIVRHGEARRRDFETKAKRGRYAQDIGRMAAVLDRDVLPRERIGEFGHRLALGQVGEEGDFGDGHFVSPCIIGSASGEYARHHAKYRRRFVIDHAIILAKRPMHIEPIGQRAAHQHIGA